MEPESRCESCRFAATVKQKEGLVCIRFPPGYDLQRSAREGVWSGFPRINLDWVCGEWQAIAPAGRPAGRPKT